MAATTSSQCSSSHIDSDATGAKPCPSPSDQDALTLSNCLGIDLVRAEVFAWATLLDMRALRRVDLQLRHWATAAVRQRAGVTKVDVDEGVQAQGLRFLVDSRLVPDITLAEGTYILGDMRLEQHVSLHLEEWLRREGAKRGDPDEFTPLAHDPARRGLLFEVMSMGGFEPRWRPGWGPLRPRHSVRIGAERLARGGHATVVLSLAGSGVEVDDAVVRIDGEEQCDVTFEHLTIGGDLCPSLYVRGHGPPAAPHPFAGPVLRMHRCEIANTCWLAGRAVFSDCSGDVDTTLDARALCYIYGANGMRKAQLGHDRSDQGPWRLAEFESEWGGLVAELVGVEPDPKTLDDDIRAVLRIPSG